MLRRLYDWTIRLAARPDAERALFAVSFAESSVFPIPPDALLIPMAIARPLAAWRLALVCTLASVLGALGGYVIGAFLFETVAQPLFELYGYAEKFDSFVVLYNEWGVWIVAMAGLTPFPFKVITIASGAAQMNLVPFVIASILSRGARFYAVAGLIRLFGPQVRDFIERRLGLVFSVGMALLFGGFALVKLLD